MAEGNTPKDVAVRYIESFASGDPETVAANVTEDFVNNQSGALGKGCETRAVYRERLKGFLRAFEGLQYEVKDVIEDGSKVAITYQMRAKSDGHSIDIPGVMVIDVRDGLVAERQDYWDGLTFLQQTKQA